MTLTMGVQQMGVMLAYLPPETWSHLKPSGFLLQMSR